MNALESNRLRWPALVSVSVATLLLTMLPGQVSAATTAPPPPVDVRLLNQLKDTILIGWGWQPHQTNYSTELQVIDKFNSQITAHLEVPSASGRTWLTGLPRSSYLVRIRNVSSLGGISPWTELAPQLETTSVAGDWCTLDLLGKVKCSLGANYGVADDVQIDLPRLTSISAGGNHFCGITRLEEVFCWGYSQSQYGTYGTSSGLPGLVQGLNGVRSVQAFGDSTCAIENAGVLKCWGANPQGAVFGSNNKNYAFSFRPLINADFPEAKRFLGSVFCVQTETNPAACTGVPDVVEFDGGKYVGSDGQLHPDKAADVLRISVGFGNRQCLLNRSGSVYCWGTNAYGEVGDGCDPGLGIICSRYAEPRLVNTLQSSAVAIATYGMPLAILDDGSLWVWGGTGFRTLFRDIQTSVLVADVPDAPIHVIAVPSFMGAMLRWSAPNDNGSPLLRYIVSWEAIAKKFAHLPSARGTQVCLKSPCKVQVPARFSYRYSVAAYNTVGESVASPALLRRCPLGKPVTKIQNTSPRRGEQKISWAAPKTYFGCPILKYYVVWKAAGTQKYSRPLPWISNSVTLKGWTKGRKYQVWITAANSTGGRRSEAFTIIQSK